MELLSMNDKPSKILKKVKSLYTEYKASTNPNQQNKKGNAVKSNPSSSPSGKQRSSKQIKQVPSSLSIAEKNTPEEDNHDNNALEVNKLIEIIPVKKNKMEIIEKDFIYPSVKVIIISLLVYLIYGITTVIILSQFIQKLTASIFINQKITHVQKYSLTGIIAIQFSIALNKTNLLDENFAYGGISQFNDQFIDNSITNFYGNYENFKNLIENNLNLDSIKVLNDKLQGPNLCHELFSLPYSVLDNYTAVDNAAFKYELENSLCKNTFPMNSNLDTIFSYVFARVRDNLYKLISNYTIPNMLNIYNSKEMNEIVLINMLYFSPYFNHLKNNLNAQISDNSKSDLLFFCILIFIINILLDIITLVVIKFLVLDNIQYHIENVKKINDCLKS